VKSVKTKRQYRLRNWSEYNAALVNRGSVTIWLDEAALSDWLCSERSGRRGASLIYSAVAIEAVLLWKAVYHLPLRGAQGFARSLMQLMGLTLPTPHYSTLCRRQIGLELALPRFERGQALHLVVDSTGCKVYGEGSGKCGFMGQVKEELGASRIWAWTRKVVRSWRRS
jgi:hypothetical protein